MQKLITLLFILLTAGQQIWALPTQEEGTDYSPEFWSGLSAAFPRCELLHLSSDGLVGYLIKGGYEQLQPGFYSKNFGDHRNRLHYWMWKIDPKQDGLTANLADHREPPFTSAAPGVRSMLLKLANMQARANLPILNLRSVSQWADKELLNRQGQGLGECYYVFLKPGAPNAGEAHEPLIQEIPQAVQASIERVFQERESLHFTYEESEHLINGSLVPDEVRELRALKAATEIFEKNTVLVRDVGGWTGNSPFQGDIATRCTEETATYRAFMRRLAKKGLLQHFEPMDFVIVRSTWVLDVDAHEANIIANVRTKQLLVVDSWLDDGGQPARILMVTNWLAKKDGTQVVK